MQIGVVEKELEVDRYGRQSSVYLTSMSLESRQCNCIALTYSITGLDEWGLGRLWLAYRDVFHSNEKWKRVSHSGTVDLVAE